MALGGLGKKSGCQCCQLPARSKPRKGRQKIGGDRKRDDHRQRSRIGALRILHFLGDSGKLFVSGVKPEPKRQADAENLESRLVREESTATNGL